MADIPLPRLAVSRKSGRELFHDGDTFFEFDLLNFWQWSASDLVSNALRGRLAEFLVAQSLGLAGGVRAEWDPFDLCTSDGLAIEVKSAAYVQSWGQKALSFISFDIAPTRHWDPSTNVLAANSRRQADLYVFALLAHREKATIDPMDLAQWEFLVLSATALNERFPRQKQIGLATLHSLNPERCRFDLLRETILQVGKTIR